MWQEHIYRTNVHECALLHFRRIIYKFYTSLFRKKGLYSCRSVPSPPRARVSGVQSGMSRIRE